MGIVLAVVGGILGGRYAQQHDDRLYSGKEVFFTQEEYTTFKIEVAKKEVAVEKTYILSSDTPIIVDFTVRVPYDHNFPYGRNTGSAGVWILWMLVPGAIAMVCGVVLILNWPYKEEAKG